MDMTNNMTKTSLKTLLEDIGFEADNDEETIYKLAINEDKNYSGPFNMLTITVYFDYKFPRNKFNRIKIKIIITIIAISVSFVGLLLTMIN